MHNIAFQRPYTNAIILSGLHVFPPSFVSLCTLLFAITGSELPSEKFQSMVEWLKYNVAPSSQVNSFMEKTAVKRAEWIRKNTGQSFGNILKEYPRLFNTPW